MEQMKQAMGTLEQGGTGPLVLKIKARVAFPPEEWGKALQGVPGDQREAQEATLCKILADATLDVIRPDWSQWDESSGEFLEAWPFVRVHAARKMRPPSGRGLEGFGVPHKPGSSGLNQ